jgi:hypothetical protein
VGAVANFDWFALVKDGGAYCAPLLLAAVIWLAKDRARLVDELKSRDERLEALAERVITIATELRNFLFNERKA